MSEEKQPQRLEISLVQVAASALAAMSAAVLASFLGVAGTLIGTAVMSVIATTGSALYSHSIRRTQARLRRTVVLPLHRGQQPAHAPSGVAVAAEEPTPRWKSRWRPRWKPLVATVVVVFLLALAGITVVEAIAGRSLSAAVHGRSKGAPFTLYPMRETPTSPTPTPTPTASTGASTSPSPSANPSPSASTPSATSSPGTPAPGESAPPSGSPGPTSAPSTGPPPSPAPSPVP